jgi:hypothetical protein
MRGAARAESGRLSVMLAVACMPRQCAMHLLYGERGMMAGSNEREIMIVCAVVGG